MSSQEQPVAPTTLDEKSLQETSRPATTTTEQDLRSAGQRQINMLWERTQAAIAIVIVGANVINAFIVQFLEKPNESSSRLLESSLFLIIGFYFSRTNHARIGDEQPRATKGNLDDR